MNKSQRATSALFDLGYNVKLQDGRFILHHIKPVNDERLGTSSSPTDIIELLSDDDDEPSTKFSSPTALAKSSSPTDTIELPSCDGDEDNDSSYSNDQCSISSVLMTMRTRNTMIMCMMVKVRLVGTLIIKMSFKIILLQIVVDV